VRDLDELGAAVASMQAPVLLLTDPEDRLVPFDTARQLAQGLPDARLRLAGGAGHHLPRRAPDAIAALLQILDSSDPDDCT
jgi:3-oxoadipate enol-lactonase